MSIATFSTDDVQQHERFDFWRDAMCSHFYGMTFDLQPRKRPDFQARLTAKSVGDVSLVDLRASACVIHRLDSEIETAPGNALFLYRQTTGAAWIEAVDRREQFVVETNTLAMGDSDLPFTTAPTDGHPFDCTVLKIPFARIDALTDPAARFSAHRVQPSAGIGALLTAYFDAFCREIDYLDGKAADVALQTLAQLTAVAHDAVSSMHESAREAIRTARRRMVREFVERNLHRADLTPATTAKSLGISVRQLHLLFEPAGKSFTRYLQSRRVERARSLIVHGKQLRITDIAYDCGFDSFTTFYRTFRSAFGMSPTELRQSIASDDRT